MMLTAISYLLCIAIPFALFLATLRNHLTSPLSTRWRGEKKPDMRKTGDEYATSECGKWCEVFMSAT